MKKRVSKIEVPSGWVTEGIVCHDNKGKVMHNPDGSPKKLNYIRMPVGTDKQDTNLHVILGRNTFGRLNDKKTTIDLSDTDLTGYSFRCNKIAKKGDSVQAYFDPMTDIYLNNGNDKQHYDWKTNMIVNGKADTIVVKAKDLAHALQLRKQRFLETTTPEQARSFVKDENVSNPYDIDDIEWDDVPF